jgi:hypothetical protein
LDGAIQIDHRPFSYFVYSFVVYFWSSWPLIEHLKKKRTGGNNRRKK